MAEFTLTERAAADLEHAIQNGDLDAPSHIADALRKIDVRQLEDAPAFTNGYDAVMLKRLQEYSGKPIDEIALFYGQLLEPRSYDLEVHIDCSRIDLLRVVVMIGDSPVNPRILQPNKTRMGSVNFDEGDYCFNVKVGEEEYLIRAKQVDLVSPSSE